jgi:hypothetical protein
VEASDILIQRVAAGLALSLMLVGCSQTSDTPNGVAVTTSAALAPSATTLSTTTTTTVPTHAVGYPNIPIAVRPLTESDISNSQKTRAEIAEDAAVPEFVYGNDFTPSTLHLNPPRPVKFTNPTDEDIVITFSTGQVEDLEVAAGASEVIDFTSMPEEIYRFHVWRGMAKIGGFIDMRPQGASTAALPDGTLKGQAPFSGLFSIRVPNTDKWKFNPQYNAVVAVPSGDPWHQGDFQWSLVTGAPLNSSGLRIELVELDDPGSILANPVVPEGCALESTGRIQRSSFDGVESVYECEWATLYLGYVDTGGGLLAYVVSDSLADPAGVLFDALDSVKMHPDGDAITQIDLDDPVDEGYVFRNDDAVPWPNYWDTTPYPIDIEGGGLSAGVALDIGVLNVAEVELRNFDDFGYAIEVNGVALCDLAPRSAVRVNLDDFEQDLLNLTIAASPLAAYGLMIDMETRRPDPPEEMYSDPGPVDLDLIAVGVGDRADEFGVAEVMLPVPRGWVATGELQYWRYRYERDTSLHDPAAVELNLAVGVDTSYFLNTVSGSLRVLPEQLDPVSERGLTWTVYQWSPEGHPTVTMLLVEDGNDTVLTASLTSSPEDHHDLYEDVLLPMVRGFFVVPVE